MPYLTILIVIFAAGVLLWLINNYISMDRKVKKILNVVIVVFAIIWLLQIFGAFSYIRGFRI